MHKKRLSILLGCGLVLLCFQTTPLAAQQLDKLKDAPLLKVSGGIGASAMFTNSTDPNNERDPFFYQLQGNLNFNILGIINAPFSVTLNSQETALNQPALPTQIGVSPNYKWLTLHGGYRSLRFSDFTLGGLMFLGGGFEVKPKEGWVQGSAMYGRFSEATQPVLGTGLGRYERIGMAGRVRFGNDKDNVSLILFRAKDDPNSITLDSTMEDIAPQENLVWSIIGNKRIKRLSLGLEYATSALTKDTRNEEFVLDNYSYYNNLGNFFKPNATTVYRHAITVTSKLNMDGYHLNFGFKQVDPDFQSLGATSINNDFREYTAGIGWQMFARKLSVATNGGLQRNNLDDSQIMGVRRFIGSVTVNWSATEQLNLNATHSNFNSTAVRSADYLSDTLEFFQTTRNTTLSGSYMIKTYNPQSIIFSGNYQEAFDSEGNQNDAFNTNLSHSLSFTDSKLTLATSVNYNLIISSGSEIANYGPTLAMSKPLTPAIMTSLAVSRLQSDLEGELQNIITNVNFSYRWKFYKSHNITANYMMLNRNSRVEGTQSVTENRMTVKYAYSF